MWLSYLLIFIVICLTGARASSDELTGRNIIEEQQERHLTDHEFASVELILVDRKGKENQQQIKIFSMKKDKKTKTLIQYTAPAKVRGVGLLTWEQGRDKDDDQWLYMPASKSIKRIAGSSKKTNSWVLTWHLRTCGLKTLIHIPIHSQVRI